MRFKFTFFKLKLSICAYLIPMIVAVDLFDYSVQNIPKFQRSNLATTVLGPLTCTPLVNAT